MASRTIRKPTKNSEDSGPPRWTYVAGAIVSALTLGWTITQGIISLKQGDKATAHETPNVVTTVVGNNNTAVGINNGQITYTSSAAAPVSSVPATPISAGATQPPPTHQ